MSIFIIKMHRYISSVQYCCVVGLGIDTKYLLLCSRIIKKNKTNGKKKKSISFKKKKKGSNPSSFKWDRKKGEVYKLSSQS